MPATALPSSGAPTPSYSCDTSDLLMIHRFFRKIFLDAVKAVERVPAGDTVQCGIVADHLIEIDSWLHTHHHGEDDLLWDLLESRTPSCRVHVEQMKAQHLEVAALIESVEAGLPAWRTTASTADRQVIVDRLIALNTAFGIHLGQEEGDIAPIAAVSISQAEFDRLGEHGRAATDRKRAFVQLGYILSGQNDEQAAAFMKEIPPPVRLLWRLVGKRQYEKDRARVYGAAA